VDSYDAEVLRRIRQKLAITPERGCWEWTGYKLSDGYGQVGYRGKVVRVHRLVFELMVGTIPPGKQLDHYACDNPPCCNPAHLRPATNRENSLRSSSPMAINSRKTHCSRGHEFTPESTYVNPRGMRNCRTCKNTIWNPRYQAKRAER
jgi:hypothetical protein